MNDTIVVYRSKYGSTDIYAKWIGEALGCRVSEIRNLKKRDLERYKIIIYGGGIHAGGIRGWDVMQKWLKLDLMADYYKSKEGTKSTNPKDEQSKKVMIFAVGIGEKTEENLKQLRDVNLYKKWQTHIPCYIFSGAYRPEKVKGIDGFIMKMMVKFLRDKGLNMSREERILINRVKDGCDLINKDEISALVEDYKNLI